VDFFAVNTESSDAQLHVDGPVRLDYEDTLASLASPAIGAGGSTSIRRAGTAILRDRPVTLAGATHPFQ
jgi:hypothetical protein